MSLLLDALNKADQERKRNEATPGINSNHGQVGDHSNRTPSSVVIAAAFIGFVILLAAIYWLGQRSIATAPTAAATISSIPASPNSSQVVHKNPAAPRAQISTESAPEANNTEADVANLYAQNTQTIEPATSAPITEAIATNNTGNTEALPSTAPASTLPPSTPTSITQFANLPDLHDLPSQILVKIPSLNYSEHNFNNVGGSVKINGEIKHVNDQLAPGLVIDKILEDGMILHLDNYSFKMRALNSWVNM
jgi:general secretion pathway protein B